jgi:hypothetical protein
MGNIHDATLADPDNVDVEAHVLHPKAGKPGRRVLEQHAVTPGEFVAVPEALGLLGGGADDFELDLLVANGDRGRFWGTGSGFASKRCEQQRAA